MVVDVVVVGTGGVVVVVGAAVVVVLVDVGGAVEDVDVAGVDDVVEGADDDVVVELVVVVAPPSLSATAGIVMAASAVTPRSAPARARVG